MDNIAWPINMDMIRGIAMLNPRLAFMLVRGNQLVPRAYNIEVTFEDAAKDQVLSGALYERMFQDAWIKDLRYTIRREDAFAGNIAKWQSDNYAALESYVDVFIRIEGQDKYRITNSYTPLESIASHTNGAPGANVLGNAWTITRDQNFYVDFKLRRTLLDDEVPYNIVFTLHVLELSGCSLKAVDYTEALCALRKIGICPETCEVTSPQR